MKPKFFPTPAALRRWLATHHARVDELWVGFWKRATGKPSVTWPQAVDQALCFGWIDGVRKSLDDDSYVIRFTPRRGSTWSTVNTARVRALVAEGLMQPAGLAAFEARDEKKSASYAYENRHKAVLPPAYEKQLRASAGWTFFSAQPPWYRRTAIHWVTSAKREETRARRLATLIADSAAGRPIAPLARPGKPRPT